MSDLEILRPEVREALDRLVYFLTGTHNHNDFYTIRAELLRLAEYEQAAGRLAIEKAELRQCAEQCEAELAAMPDADEWHALRERAKRAEAELAALKARIGASRLIEPGVQFPVPGYVGKRVRLVVEE